MADVDPRNDASIGLLKSLGFRLDGHADNTFCIAGEWVPQRLLPAGSANALKCAVTRAACRSVHSTSICQPSSVWTSDSTTPSPCSHACWLALGKGQGQASRGLRLVEGGRDGVQQGVDPLARQGRHRKDIRARCGPERPGRRAGWHRQGPACSRPRRSAVLGLTPSEVRMSVTSAACSADSGWQMSRTWQDQISFQNLFQGGAEGGDQLGRQVGDEAHSVGGDDLAARWQHNPAHRRVQRGKQHVLGQHLCAGHPVEQRRFPGVGIADQSHQRKRHLAARGAVQFACFYNAVQLSS